MSKDHINISGHFLRDAYDYINRYDICFKFSGVSPWKSWNTKLFIDLQMAFECILKSILIFYLHSDKNREEAKKIAQKYNHNIGSLINICTQSQLIPNSVRNKLSDISSIITKLPISLRYSADLSDFREINEDIFYKFIRNERWIENYKEQLINIIYFF